MSDSPAPQGAREGNAITKNAFDSDKDSTLPNPLSNPRPGGLLDGSVMWAVPKPSGLGSRSEGPYELQQAGGVLGKGAAEQTPLPGATLAVCKPAHQAGPDAQTTAPTMRSVIENRDEDEDEDEDEDDDDDAAQATEADAWAAWRSKAHKLASEGAFSARSVDNGSTQFERAQAFDIVKAARSMVQAQNEGRRARQDTPATAASLADYAKKCRQIDAEIDNLAPGSPNPLFEVMSRHTARQPTFSALKTALKSRGLARVKALLAEQGALQRTPQDSTAWTRAVQELQRAAREVQMIEALSWQDCLAFSGTKVKASMSKKRDLPKLPAGWQNRFLNVNQSSPTYRMAGVLLRHCGLRPKELAKGVHLEATAGGVRVRIEGAKVRQTAGQPWRQFMLLGEVLPEWFVDEVRSQASTVVRVSEDGLRAHLGRLSGLVLNANANANANGKAKRVTKGAPILSAYLFRHALVTQLREAGWDSEGIAAVIGEGSAATVRYYGTRVRTHSRKPKPLAIVAVSVETARPVSPVDMSGLKRIQKKSAKGYGGPNDSAH